MRCIQARLTAASAIILAASVAALAQEPAPQAAKPVAKDYYQRSLQTYEFKKAAPSGAERGREIFYYKCWFCHNEFSTTAPHLTGLYQRGTLLSGLPVHTKRGRPRRSGELRARQVLLGFGRSTAQPALRGAVTNPIPIANLRGC
jgi:hypothetical protein